MSLSNKLNSEDVCSSPSNLMSSETSRADIAAALELLRGTFELHEANLRSEFERKLEEYKKDAMTFRTLRDSTEFGGTIRMFLKNMRPGVSIAPVTSAEISEPPDSSPKGVHQTENAARRLDFERDRDPNMFAEAFFAGDGFDDLESLAETREENGRHSNALVPDCGPVSFRPTTKADAFRGPGIRGGISKSRPRSRTRAICLDRKYLFAEAIQTAATKPTSGVPKSLTGVSYTDAEIISILQTASTNQDSFLSEPFWKEFLSTERGKVLAGTNGDQPKRTANAVIKKLKSMLTKDDEDGVRCMVTVLGSAETYLALRGVVMKTTPRN